MTIYKLQYVKDLIEEAGPELASIYVYKNINSNQWMFAAFLHSSVDGMATSPYVSYPTLIWKNGDWNKIGKELLQDNWFTTHGC